MKTYIHSGKDPRGRLVETVVDDCKVSAAQVILAEAFTRQKTEIEDLKNACASAINDLEFRANYDESNRLPKLHGQENFWMRSHIVGTRAVVAEIRAAIDRAEGRA